MTLQQLAQHRPKSKFVESFFFENARYMEDAPTLPYFIRIGSRTLYSNDTLDLRMKLEKEVRRERARKGSRLSKRRRAQKEDGPTPPEKGLSPGHGDTGSSV